MIQKRERADLYDKFRQGAIPSGADFADLIRSQLNLVDDGIDISEDDKDPICLRAHGENDSFLDLANGGGTKKWRISGRCEDMTKEGLNITAEDQSKLYIERESGNVGINTDKPGAKLHIIQTSATDVLRIDDEGSDETPLVIDSTGQVGLGTGSPIAKLHLSHSGSGDILRVDDKDTDDTPFIIDDTGKVGIGFANPATQLVVNGGVSIGANEYHGDNDLYVAGDILVAGSVVFSGNQGIQFSAPLTSETEELTIMDNLKVMGDPKQVGSKGNLLVTGDTTLGTYNEIYENQNVVTINGRIESGGDFESGNQQFELEINKVLSISRNPSTPQTTVNGNLMVTGRTILGDALSDEIYLNGTIQTDVLINKDLNVADNVTVNKELIVTGEASFQRDIILEGNIEVKGSLIGGLPIGTIIMYDGANWQDNITIPGWYAMIAANSQYGCHDMMDRFVMGKKTAGPGQIGGENTHTLTIAEIPSHTHTITHRHGDTGYNSHSHRHYCYRFYANREDWKRGPRGGGWVGWNTGDTTGSNDTSHYHWVPDYIGNSGAVGSGVAHENRPQYYSVLFIRRCR